jgi:hypothetical protein
MHKSIDERLLAIEERLKNAESSQAELKTDLKNLRQEMLKQFEKAEQGTDAIDL